MADDIKIFISHTTQDERDHSLAHRLAKGLKVRGAEVWIAPGKISAGSKWKKGIISSVTKECTHFRVILSAASTKADWVLREIALAKERFYHDSTDHRYPTAGLIPMATETNSAFLPEVFSFCLGKHRAILSQNIAPALSYMTLL